MIVVLAVPAYAQDTSGGRSALQAPGGRSLPPGKKNQKTPAEVKAEEKAYQDTLKRIPSQGEAFDPWQGVRSSEPAKSRKTSN
jgi:hypothetical protein